MHLRDIGLAAAQLNNMAWDRGGDVKDKTVKIIASNFLKNGYFSKGN
jgi:hypothetical protein